MNPHGVIVLTRVSVSGNNTDLSAAPTAATIAPLWDSITVSGSAQSNAYYKLETTNTGSRLVIEWYDVSFVGGPQTGQATFEAILNSDGSILFNYLDFDSNLLGAGDIGPTVGIKNANTSGADPLVVPMTSGAGPVVVSGGSLEIAPNIAPAVNNYYAFTLAAGQTTTLAVRSQNSAAVHVALLDSQGNPLANRQFAGLRSECQSKAIGDYVAPTTGTYYAHNRRGWRGIQPGGHTQRRVRRGQQCQLRHGRRHHRNRRSARRYRYVDRRELVFDQSARQ